MAESQNPHIHNLDISGLQLAQPGKLQTTKGKLLVLLAQAKLQTLVTPYLGGVFQ